MATAQVPDFPLDVELDSEVAPCWQLSAWIGALSSDDHLSSFTSVLIALLYGQSALSRWFLRYAGAAGVHLDEICSARDFRPAKLQEIRQRQRASEIPSGKPANSTSAKMMAEAAAELRVRMGDHQLGIRHLLGAYSYNVPQVHQEQMKRWGFDPQRDGSALLRQIPRRYDVSLEKWIEVHTTVCRSAPDLEAKDPIIPPRISGFAPDSPDGDDRLDIEDDVYALSALICSTRISPPLSVGLFGDWGSGKSFFIRKLQKGVSWISEQARDSNKMQKDLPFYKHVVQIEFNAWNYAEGNLWAALVQHILDNLRISDREPEDLVAKRRAHFQGQMELETKVLDVAREKEKEAHKRADDAAKDLQNLRESHEKRVNELKEWIAKDILDTVRLDQAAVTDINTLRKDLRLPEVQNNAAEFLAALQETRSVLQRASTVLEYVPEGQRTRFFVGSALVLILPTVLAVAIGLAVADPQQPYIALIAAASGWLSTTLATATAWLRNRTKALHTRIAEVEKLQAHARQRVQAAEQVHRAEAAQLEQRIALARDEILAAQTKQQEAQERLDQAQMQLLSTTPASVLADLVRERASSEDYRKHLGLPAVIRRDFDNISGIIAKENKELADKTSLEDERRNSDQRINRIVLYIDDLDRCPERLVIEVLKAVHLLLAFPLFVVVVAVDARWLSQSLANRFPGLLSASAVRHSGGASLDAAHATPSDYLEKIFQIPFWLRQPSEESVKRMVSDLAREGVAPRAAASAATVHDDDATSTTRQPVSVFKKRQHDPNASLLDIQPEELDYIDKLAPLLDRSPRAIKRFVNVYRLLKASLPPAESDSFLEGEDYLETPYKVVLLLLAIENGLPAVSNALFDSLLAGSRGDGLARKVRRKLSTLISSEPKDGDALLHEQTRRLVAWLNTLDNTWKEKDASQLLTWVPLVSRYSYHLHRQA